jgi:NDP-sugar pyrophosphorylase family protein
MTKSYFVHESSYVDDDVEIGEGTKIWHFSQILSGARIGSKCIIGQNVCVERGVAIGDVQKIYELFEAEDCATWQRCFVVVADKKLRVQRPKAVSDL